MPKTDQDPNLQLAEPTHCAKGKRIGKARLKPRHLSALTKQLIIDEFRLTEDIEEVCEKYRVPISTVHSLLHAHNMKRPPQPERGMPLLVRRSA